MRRLATIASVTAALVLAMPAAAQSPTPAAGAPSPTPAASAPSSAAASSIPIGGLSTIVIQLQGTDGGSATAEDQSTALATIEARLAALPDAGATVTPLDDGRIRVDLSDPDQADRVARVATTPGVFRMVAIPDDDASDVEQGGPLPSAMPIHEIVGPGHIVEAAVVTDQMGQPAIDLTLDEEAAAAFDAWAADHYGSLFAIMIDDTAAVAATINATSFNGRAQISGGFVSPRAEEIVAILRGGPLSVRAMLITLCPAPAGCPVPSAAPETSAAP
ncbi:MAG: hypothetical protein U0667_05865 [Chloroflexota bacterium]